MLDKVKLALRISTTAYDSQLNSLISACIADLKLCGITGSSVTTSSTDDLVIEAVIAFCKWRFPETPSNDAKALYELQKSQLVVSASYTDYEED